MTTDQYSGPVTAYEPVPHEVSRYEQTRYEQALYEPTEYYQTDYLSDDASGPHTAPTARATPGRSTRAGSRAAIQRSAQRNALPAWWRDVAGFAVAGSMLIILSLWVSNGGIQRLSNGMAVVAIGDLVGLVAANLLLIQVLLMARIPWIERAYGQDELARVHRLVGFGSFNLMLVHIVMIIVGYASLDAKSLVSETVNLVWTFPGMLIAAAGTGALIMVTLTSIKIARKKLRYESWHLLHLYAYIGIGLTIPHEIWTGADFIATPWARLYWWSIYIAAAGSVLVFRIGLPLYRTFAHRLVVERIVEEAPGVVSLHMRGHSLTRMPVVAGQFFVWRFLDGHGSSRGNPYSLSAAPRPRHLRITVKNLGDGSAELPSIRCGTKVVIEGPYGRLTGAVRRRRKLTMLASGIGITPIRALLEELEYAPGEAVLIYRASREEDLVFRDELDELGVVRGVKVVYLVGPRERERSSWLPAEFGHLADDEALLYLVPDIEGHDVFVCGPDPWMDAIEAAVAKAGVPREQIHTERFGW